MHCVEDTDDETDLKGYRRTSWRTVGTSDASYIDTIRVGMHSLATTPTRRTTVWAREADHIVVIGLDVHLGIAADVSFTFGIPVTVGATRIYNDLRFAADLVATNELYVRLSFAGHWRTSGRAVGTSNSSYIVVARTSGNWIGLERGHEGEGSEEEGGGGDDPHIEAAVQKCVPSGR